MRSNATLGAAGAVAANLDSISFILYATACIISSIMLVIMGWNMFVITCCIIFIMGSGMAVGMGAWVGWAGGTMGGSLDLSCLLVFASLVFDSCGVTSLPPAERRDAEEGGEETAAEEEEEREEGKGPTPGSMSSRKLEPCSRLSVGMPLFCISVPMSIMETSDCSSRLVEAGNMVNGMKRERVLTLVIQGSERVRVRKREI